MAVQLLCHAGPMVSFGTGEHGTGYRVLYSDQISKESEVGCPARAREGNPVPETPQKVGLTPRVGKCSNDQR